MNGARTDHGSLVDLTVGIVGAYVSNNHVQAVEITRLISDVHSTLSGLGLASKSVNPHRERITPAEIRRSVTPAYLVSFEDGKPYKTLRRHLTLRGLTPEQYRAKWGLPPDYPMTSKDYSEQRSELARALGLGQQRRKWAQAASTEGSSKGAGAVEATQKGSRGRPHKGA